jgi:hypothetical protein
MIIIGFRRWRRAPDFGKGMPPVSALTPARSRAAARLAGLGALGAVGAVLAAPLAHAETVAPLITTSPSPSPDPTTSSPSPAPTSTAPTPNYGFQKIRVGIELKPGAYVAPGTSLAGATLQIVTSATSAPLNVASQTLTCTTGSDGFCTSIGAAITAGITPAAAPTGTLTLAPGQSAVVTQLTAPTGLVKDSASRTQQPCVGSQCQTAPAASVVLEDTGTLPSAASDTASVPAGSTVSIDVLKNDSTGGAPVTSLTVTQPAHGTVTVHGTVLDYRAKAGFAGTDSFSYTLTTANGSTTATVQVQVAAAATSTPTASPTATPTASAEPASTLASTGVSGTGDLAWTGAGLVAGGALVLVAAGRRVGSGRRH